MDADEHDNHAEHSAAQSEPPSAPAAAPIVETLAVGMLQANCYVVACPATRLAAILDPGDEAERILERVRALGVTVTHMLHTHGHFDHISATEAVLSGLSAGAQLGTHPADAYLYTAEMGVLAASLGYPAPTVRARPALALEDDVEVAVGTLRLRVLQTPGHTPGGVSLLCAPWCVFTGDTLFRRGIGRSDLDGGDEDALYASIATRLYTLDPALTVYPGHGDATTIGEERRLNPFVRA